MMMVMVVMMGRRKRGGRKLDGALGFKYNHGCQQTKRGWVGGEVGSD